MKTYYLILASILVSLHISCSDSDDPTPASKPNIPPPQKDDVISRDNWTYYDGDEFDGGSIKPQYWGIYGDPKVGNGKYGQADHAMLQTYRPAQISLQKLPTGESVCRIKAEKSTNAPKPNVVEGKTGWWSGALSSRDSNKNGKNIEEKYYPLFCRIEIKAKLPYMQGVWVALWSRHYLGATQAAELDIAEFFVKTWDNQPPILSQALHLWDNEKNKLAYNVENERHIRIEDDEPGNNFHIYGVQVEPDPRSPREHAIITYFIDDRINYRFETYPHGNKYNKFITKAFKDNRENRTWDIAITGQIGGKESLGVGYPSDNVNVVTAEIDWIKVYVPKQ